MMATFAGAGSQRWLQVAIERRPGLLTSALQRARVLARGETIEWVSPRASDNFHEYRDGAALRKVGLRALDKVPLAKFWPARGPVWDALGLASPERPVLVEAKAHIPEAASSGTRASRKSLPLIRKSLAEARRFYASRSHADWTGTFYQYANRLAHHYWLHQLNGRNSTLVFLYFLHADDMQGPATEIEWRGAIRLLRAVLGLPADLSRFGVYDVFIDVRFLQDVV